MQMLEFLIFLDNWIELDKLALMVFAIFYQFGELLANGLDVVEAGEGHVAVEIGGRGAWVNREDLYRRAGLLEFDGHHTHHRILCGLAGNVGQRMPVGTDL